MSLLEDLAAAAPHERRAIKARAMAALDRLDGHTFTRRQLAVTIVDPRVVDGDLVLSLVITRGGRDVTPPDLNPITIRNPPVLVPDPAGDVVRESTDEAGNVIRAAYALDPRRALLAVLADLIR